MLQHHVVFGKRLDVVVGFSFSLYRLNFFHPFAFQKKLRLHVPPCSCLPYPQFRIPLPPLTFRQYNKIRTTNRKSFFQTEPPTHQNGQDDEDDEGRRAGAGHEEDDEVSIKKKLACQPCVYGKNKNVWMGRKQKVCLAQPKAKQHVDQRFACDLFLPRTRHMTAR
ncbi:unnamed protein product [Amoebophrya sp. A120]|nr:unnamed protein product [Amoebophrya sp. A120]|eukprot:GSA120T00010603001.1